ncbi:MAG TPA: molybdate ABC transporter substrate-binding protein [Solirubrobacterales bacterium]|nr:molybdate ABC transporter substrate-binding protein [Solirubrobacterales bacterium]
MRRGAGLAGALCLLILLGGCGGDSDGDGAGGRLVVLGASSLAGAVGEYAESFPAAGVKPSFAGSDQLAAQIQQGVKADVFASADTEYPAELHEEGLVEKPRVFAANELVIAVPEGSDVAKLSDLAKPGVKLVIGDPGVPVGDYTRTVLDRLPTAEREAILANVRSEETEVSSVVAKLEQGAADAGFVYVTDEQAAAGLHAVPIPSELQPDVAYAAAVVSSSSDKPAAEEFLDGLVSGEGQEDLRRAGFLPPP